LAEQPHNQRMLAPQVRMRRADAVRRDGAIPMAAMQNQRGTDNVLGFLIQQF
jgi:hypothetical protein